MTIGRSLRIIAGTMILISVALTYFVSPLWILFTAFIGFNLLQSGSTSWCPMIGLLKATGMRSADTPCKRDQNS